MEDALVGLIFHGIGTPGRTLEPNEAPYWLSTDRFEAILERIAALSEPHRVRISFDDGNLSDVTIALPRLLAHGFPADVFVLSRRIGAAGSLGAAQIVELQTAGCRIGSHGVSHQDWRRISPDALAAELTDSRTTLERVCDRPVTSAGIPFGSYNGRVIAALKSAGYDCAYSSDRGTMYPGAYLRPRTSVRADMTDAEIDMILAGRMARVARVRRTVGMLRRRLFPG